MGRLIFSRNTPAAEVLTSSHPIFLGSGFEDETGEGFSLVVRRLTPLDRARVQVRGKEIRDSLPAGAEGDAMYNMAFSALVFEQQVEEWDGFAEEHPSESTPGTTVITPITCTQPNKAMVAQQSPRLAAAVANWVYGGEGEGVRKEGIAPLKVVTP